jgi:hypothetical protein
MSLEPSLPMRPTVICLCACSLDHPNQPNICEPKSPAVVAEMPITNKFSHRYPVCEPCAHALGLPILIVSEEEHGLLP